MVLLHNKLNEDAWNQVLQWESRFHGGYEHISLENLDIHLLYQRYRSGQARARIVFRHSWPPLKQGSFLQIGEALLPYLFHVCVFHLRDIDARVSSTQ